MQTDKLYKVRVMDNLKILLGNLGYSTVLVYFSNFGQILCKTISKDKS